MQTEEQLQQPGPQPQAAEEPSTACAAGHATDALLDRNALLDKAFEVVEGYCADEFDAWERECLEHLHLTNDQRQAVHEGIEHAYLATWQRLQQSFAHFDEFATAVPLHVPAGLQLSPEEALDPAAGQAPVSAEEEAAALGELQALQAQLAQALAANSTVQLQLKELQAELEGFGGLLPELQCVADMLADKENGAALAELAGTAKRVAACVDGAAELVHSSALLSGAGNRSAALNADKEVARRQAAIAAAPLERLAALQAQLGI